MSTTMQQIRRFETVSRWTSIEPPVQYSSLPSRAPDYYSIVHSLLCTVIDVIEHVLVAATEVPVCTGTA